MVNDVPEGDVGAVSIAIVLLAPILVFLMFAGFQAAMWNHTRTEARVVARETAVLVARDHLTVERASQAASASLSRDSVLTDANVAIDATEDRVVVTITGDAPGLLRGTSAPVTVSVALPIEGWVQL